MNAILSSLTQLAFPLLPCRAITRRTATPIDAFAFTITAPATTATATTTPSTLATAAAAIQEIVFGTGEETRSKLNPSLPAILGRCGRGYERQIRRRRLGTERN
jgi:hypothetical protein